jgi:hypothetical protein
MLLVVALYDLIMLNTGWVLEMLKTIGNSKRKSSRMSYIDESIEIGMGELIFYSFIPAHVEAYFSQELLVMTLVMTGIGVLLNLWILQRRGVVAGLPAPIFLGLAPLILNMLLRSS